VVSQQVSAASKATPYWGFSPLKQLSLLSILVSGRRHGLSITFKRENGSLEPESCTKHHTVSFVPADGSQAPSTAGMLVPKGLGEHPETSLLMGGVALQLPLGASPNRGERKRAASLNY